jgi:hypothetical protein
MSQQTRNQEICVLVSALSQMFSPTQEQLLTSLDSFELPIGEAVLDGQLISCGSSNTGLFILIP